MYTQFLRLTAFGTGLGLLSLAGLQAQMPPATTAPPAGAPTTVERVYTDEVHGITVQEPGNWERGKKEAVSMPGQVSMVWSPDGTTTATIFVQKPGKAVNPWLLLAESAKALKGALNVTSRTEEVRDVAGMKAMYLLVEGMGTGAAIDGKGTVPTLQHWVAIPRQEDIVILLLITTSGNYSITGPPFDQMVSSLQLTGEQTPGQQIDPSTLPNQGQPMAPAAPAHPDHSNHAAPAAPEPPPPPPPARG